MHDQEKSDSAIVAVKSPNKTGFSGGGGDGALALAVGHIPAVRRPPTLQPPAQRLGVVHVPGTPAAVVTLPIVARQGLRFPTGRGG